MEGHLSLILTLTEAISLMDIVALLSLVHAQVDPLNFWPEINPKFFDYVVWTMTEFGLIQVTRP